MARSSNSMRVDTETSAGREALRASLKLVSRAKQQWESTIDSLPDLVFLVATDRRVIRANRTLESWGLGSVRAVDGQDLHEILHPACAHASCPVLELWNRFAKARTASESLECDFRDALLGRRIHLSMHRPESFHEGDPTTVVVRDRSEIYEREEVRRRKDRLDTMEYVLGGLAHEVGNPIAAIKTTLDVWRRSFDRFDRETHERYLTRVEEGLDRLRASVDRVLAGELKEVPRCKPVPIRALLERVQSLFIDHASENGIVFTVGTSVEAAETVLGDPAAIDDVLTNVTKNALEACERGDRVSVRVELRDREASFEIADSGAGISADDMERLFAPFYTSKPTGTGLGLALSNQLMQQMGGRIEIESDEGVGTVARLHLPRSSPVIGTP